MKPYITRSGRGEAEKEKPRYSKIIVTLVIIMNVAFTAAVLFIYLKIGSEPTALIAAWFAFTTGELWLLANIKRAEINEKEGKNARPNNGDY